MSREPRPAAPWATSDASMPAGNVSARRKARKRALDVLYQADLRDDSIRGTLDGYLVLAARPPLAHHARAARGAPGVHGAPGRGRRRPPGPHRRGDLLVRGGLDAGPDARGRPQPGP